MPSPYLTNLNDSPDWQREIARINEAKPTVPYYHPNKPITVEDAAYYAGMVAGWNLLLNKLGVK